LQKQPLVRIDQDESGRKALVLWPRRVTVHTGNVRGARRTGIFGSGVWKWEGEWTEGGGLGANSLNAIKILANLLIAIDPTCHRHKKIISMPFSGIQGIGENFNGIQGIDSFRI